MLATFFSSIEEKLESLRQKKVDGIRRFLDYIWKKYDTDESGFIEADETKQMLEDVTGQNETMSKQDIVIKKVLVLHEKIMNQIIILHMDTPLNVEEKQLQIGKVE